MQETILTAEQRAFPLRFLMWLYVVTVVMLFAGLTSAMIVSMRDNMANQSWVVFSMPALFAFTTGAIVASSGTLFWAYYAAKRNRFQQLNAALWSTLVLGLLFLTGQYLGFVELYDMGVYFVDNSHKIGAGKKVFNASGSFFMVMTGMHAVHIMAASIALVVQCVKALLYKINSTKLLGLQLTSIFWHSLGVIWLYLYIFLSVVYS